MTAAQASQLLARYGRWPGRTEAEAALRQQRLSAFIGLALFTAAVLILIVQLHRKDSHFGYFIAAVEIPLSAFFLGLARRLHQARHVPATLPIANRKS